MELAGRCPGSTQGCETQGAFGIKSLSEFLFGQFDTPDIWENALAACGRSKVRHFRTVTLFRAFVKSATYIASEREKGCLSPGIDLPRALRRTRADYLRGQLSAQPRDARQLRPELSFAARRLESSARPRGLPCSLREYPPSKIGAESPQGPTGDGVGTYRRACRDPRFPLTLSLRSEGKEEAR